MEVRGQPHTTAALFPGRRNPRYALVLVCNTKSLKVPEMQSYLARTYSACRDTVL